MGGEARVRRYSPRWSANDLANPLSFVKERIVSSVFRTRPIRRRTALAGLSAGAVAGLAACSNSGDVKSGGTSSPAGGGAQSPSESSKPSAEWTNVDASLLETTDVTLNPEAEGKTVTTPRFPQARNLTQATEVVRNRLLREAHWDDIEKVAIEASILAAAQDVVGVAVLGSLGSDEANVPCTIWYDARKRQSFAPAALIEAAKWGDFAKAVHDAASEAKLDAKAVDQALIEKSAPYGNGPAMAFSPEGTLVLAFRAGAAGDDSARLVVDAEAFLSDLGKLAKDASANPAKFTGEPSEELEHFTPARHRVKPIDSPNRPSDGSEAPSSPASDGGGSDASQGGGDATKVPEPTAGGAVRPSTAIGYDVFLERCVALTYDDGPGARTPELLEVYKNAKAAATFFEMGNSVKEHRKTSLKVAAAGQEIGNHSMTHPDLKRKSRERVEKEVNKNSDLLAEATGFEPLLFRPPYGSHNAAADEIIAARGMAIVQWNVDTLDWKTKDTAKTIEAAVEGAEKYTEPIALMHDIHDATIDAAEQILSQLAEGGYIPVTVSELTLNTGGVETGHAYCTGTGIKQSGFNCKG